MSDDRNHTLELLLRQYDPLRKEIENCTHEPEQLATYGVIASGVGWSAVLGQAEIRTQLAAHPGLKLLLIVPTAWAVLFCYRIARLDDQIDTCSEHVARLEQESYGLSGPFWWRLGWDSHWDQLRRKGAADGGLRVWHRTYWLSLIFLNFMAAGVVAWVY